MTLVGCQANQTLEVLPPGSHTVHYLLDYQRVGPENSGHLCVFNPSAQPCDLKLTFFSCEQAPIHQQLVARGQATSEWNFEDWPMAPQGRFALKVESPVPVICQATLGWTNSQGDYSPGARSKQGGAARETATSYLATTQLARSWMVADGILLDMPDKLFIREDEHLIVLNPNPEATELQLQLAQDGKLQRKTFQLPGQRLWVHALTDHAPVNRHYGVHVQTRLPVAAQWRRQVFWNQGSELMAFWSIPMQPFTVVERP